jgi:hypothetical protein
MRKWLHWQCTPIVKYALASLTKSTRTWCVRYASIFDHRRAHHFHRQRTPVLLARGILITITLLACAGATQFVRSGRPARIDGYQLSVLHMPGLGGFLSMNICEGSVRRVSSYGIREPGTWMREDLDIIIHREYEGTDPNCPFP